MSLRYPVRKQTIIGLVLLVIVVVVYVISQPREGSIERHKREYLAAWKRLGGSKWHYLVDRCYARITGKSMKRSVLIEYDGPPPPPLSKDEEQLVVNYRALIKLGYLKQYKLRRYEPRDQGARWFFYIDRRDDPFVSVADGFTDETNVSVFAAPAIVTASNLFIRWVSE
jgi:hypothetical protein